MANATSDGRNPPDTNILDLPEEVSIFIFSFLSASELGDSIAKVCTLWREYSQAYQLWRQLDYVVDGVLSKREQISVFQTASAFRRLTLKDSTSLECLLPLLFCNCSSIQELAICGEDMDPEVLRSLAKIVACGQWDSCQLNAPPSLH